MRGSAWAAVGWVCAMMMSASPARPATPCAGSSALSEMLQTEYAFAQAARSSVRGAFLQYLAEDSLVLQPGPKPGREVYGAAKDSADTLEWYPTVADVAAGGDLGFSSGPWVYTVAASGAQLHGDFLTVWRRDGECRWRVALDGGISHAAPATAAPRLAPEALAVPGAASGSGGDPLPAPSPPPGEFVAADEVARAMTDFQGTAAGDGFAPGLRTYARTRDFHLYMDGEPPMGLAQANGYLADRKMRAADWREAARGRSADATLAYSVGEVGLGKKRGRFAYIEIWQFDPRVVNWGLRMLLMAPIAKS